MSSVRPFPSLSMKSAAPCGPDFTNRVVEFPKRGAMVPSADKTRAVIWWSDLIRSVYADRESCAAEMGVAFQTACNWWDGFSGPQLAHFLRGWEVWPDQLSAALAEWPKGRRVSGRRAA